jgi:hypothetical protein
MIVPGASLIVSAAVCAALEQAVTDAEAAARRNGITPDAEVAATLVDLHELARWCRARVASAPLEMPRKRAHHRRR